MARLRYADGRVARIELDVQHPELDVADDIFPPDLAVERGGWPGGRVFRREDFTYNGDRVYVEVTTP